MRFDDNSEVAYFLLGHSVYYVYYYACSWCQNKLLQSCRCHIGELRLVYQV